MFFDLLNQCRDWNSVLLVNNGGKLRRKGKKQQNMC